MVSKLKFYLIYIGIVSVGLLRIFGKHFKFFFFFLVIIPEIPLKCENVILRYTHVKEDSQMVFVYSI